MGDLVLEMCDPGGFLPCDHQAVVVSEPIAGTGVSLTYSSEWADGRLDRPVWNADWVGLGGWSLDVLQRYDPDNTVLLGGDGSWRIADAITLGGAGASAEMAVPAFDGFQYFVFDLEWRHIRTVDAVTGETLVTFSYDSSGRLAAVAGNLDMGAVELTIERAADGTLDALVGPEGTRTRIAVGPADRLAYVGRPNGTALDLTVGATGLLQRWAVTGRGSAGYEYDDAGRVTSVTDADGVTRRFALVKTDSAVALTTSYAEDSESELRSEWAGESLRRTFTDRTGRVTTLDVNADGTTSLAGPDGTVTTTGFAPHPRWGNAAPILSPVVVTRPDGTTARFDMTTTMGTGSPEPAGYAWETRYTLNGAEYIDRYDPQTHTATRTDPVGRVSAQVFDVQGRLVERRTPGAPVEQFAYDSFGRLSSHVVGTGDSAATATYAYDTATGEIAATRADGSIAHAAVNAYGDIMRTWVDEGETASLVRNAAGDVIQVRSGDQPATSLGYSAAGRITAILPPGVGDDLAYETISYSAQGEIEKLEGPGERSIEFDYDTAGRVVARLSDAGTATADYNPGTGLLSLVSTPDGLTTSFAYTDAALIGLTWAGPVNGSVERSLDGTGAAAVEKVNGGNTFVFGHDASGLLTSIDDLAITRDPVSGAPHSSTLGSVVTTRAFDADGRLLVSTTSADDHVVARLEYGYDARGRIASVTRTHADGTTTSTSFAYDGADRLSTVTVDGTEVESYTYDAAGNRAAISSAGSTTSGTYDDRDRILTLGDESFAHSPDGNLLSRTTAEGVTAYLFDDLGELRSVTLPNGRLIEYVLDAQGRRVGRKVDGVITDAYLYGPDGTIVAWADGSGTILARFAYDEAGRLALVRRDGRDLLVVTDQLGSPIVLVEGATGGIAQETRYDAWGSVVFADGPLLTPFGFAGGLSEPDSGLVHFARRDYDPTTGRWTGPDPLGYAGGDANLYRYAGGDPVNGLDRSGLSACPAARCSPHPVSGHPAGPFPKPIVGGGGASDGDLGDPFPWPTIGPPGKWSCIGVCGPIGPIGGGVNRACWGPCAGSTPSGNNFACLFGCVWGEPHIVTVDGADLDFQAAGEFIAARSADGATVVQVRLETPPARTTVTRGTAVAMLVSGDRVAFYADVERPIVVNGVSVDRVDYEARLPGGGVVRRHGTQASITWPDGTVLGVNLYPRFINFGVTVPPDIAPGFAGILGTWDGDPANDIMTSDGQVISQSDPALFELVHHEFADSWRITAEESLFDYRSGESTDTFTRRDIPSAPASVDTLDASTRAEAEKLCRAAGVLSEPTLSDCVLDFGLTGDPSYVGSAVTVAADAALRTPAIDITTAPLTFGEQIRGELASGTVNRYVFTAEAGQIIYLEAQGECVAGLWWRLVRPDGGLGGLNDSCTDIARRELNESGQWSVDIYSDSAAAGAYAFRVVIVPAPHELQLAVGDSIAGTIEAVGEIHSYRFLSSAGQIVYLDAESACINELWWRLMRPDGALAAFNDTCTDIGRRALEVGGEWRIEVYSDFTAVGPYAFRVLGVPAHPESAIAFGQAVTGQIAAIGEWHRYRLPVTAGQVLRLDAQGECIDDMWWRVLRLDGSLAAFNTSCIDLGPVTVDTSGDWFVEVYSDFLATGPYAFTVTSG